MFTALNATLKDHLNKFELHGHAAARKCLLRLINKTNILKWALTYRDWTIEE